MAKREEKKGSERHEDASHPVSLTLSLTLGAWTRRMWVRGQNRWYDWTKHWVLGYKAMDCLDYEMFGRLVK